MQNAAVRTLPGEEPGFGRVFLDPDRGLEWSAFVGLDIEGRLCPVFGRNGIRLWSSREITADIDLASEDLLRESWRRSRRAMRGGRERWWVRWEVRGAEGTWTWFESDAGARRVLNERYPLPYAGVSELAGALETAQCVE